MQSFCIHCRAFGNSVCIIFVVDNFDFRNFDFGHANATAKGIVFVFVKVEERIGSGNDIVEQNGSLVILCVIGEDDGYRFIAVRQGRNIVAAKFRFACGHFATAVGFGPSPGIGKLKD